MNLATKNTLLIGATALVLGAATTAGVAATRGAGGFEDVAADKGHCAVLSDRRHDASADGVVPAPSGREGDRGRRFDRGDGPQRPRAAPGVWYWDADAGRAARASVLPSHVFWSGLDCTGTPFTYRSHSDGGMGATKVEMGLGDIVEHVGTYYEVVGGPASVTAASYSHQDQCTNFSSAQTVSDQMELLATPDVVWVSG